MNESETKNIKKGSLPNWVYKAGAVVGILLILAAVALYFVGGENKELQELKNTPMAFNFNPAGGIPQQLEFKLSGITTGHRGLVLTNIKMSDQYPDVIESGTLKNIGGSTLVIAHLQARGLSGDTICIYEGVFTASGYNLNENSVFEPRLVLGSGESQEIQFKLAESDDGRVAYYPRNGVKVDKVSLTGSGSETPLMASVQKAIS